MKNVVVNKWQENGVFIIGDAAHQYPPSGGYGLNMGISDALSLSWRLSYMIKNNASILSNDLGKSFQEERLTHATV
jgi:2-polyprenyl-6-methoxyphenol hydroxylase-like FAD-dependent oxidoreductase